MDKSKKKSKKVEEGGFNFDFFFFLDKIQSFPMGKGHLHRNIF